MLLLDGSGSIDAADWRLQLDGYRAAIRDNDVVPVDGTVSVGVLQFSSGVSLEIPLTLIDSPSAKQSVLDQLDTIAQRGGNTNPGDAVRSGTDHLVSSGDDGSDWFLCMSTDGVTNSGESLASARDHALLSGIDRYTVNGIEDPPGVDADVLIAHYDPHVFASGSEGVFVARDTAEFTSLIMGCFNRPLELVAVEVNQAVQDWNNSVPLIAGKRTVVRVFVESADGRATKTSGRLYGFDGAGNELPGSPLNPVNPGGGYVTAEADTTTAAQRRDVNTSLNFLLPPDWREAGTVRFKVELPGGEICPPTTDPCAIPLEHVEFQPAAGVSVEMVGIEVQDERAAPGPAALREQLRRMSEQIPVSEIQGLPFGHMAIRFAPSSRLDFIHLNNLLRALSLLDCGACYYLGAIPGASPGIGGWSNGPRIRTASGYLEGLEGDTARGHQRNLLVHELGHTLGLDHAVHGEVNEGDNPLIKRGWCGEDGPPLAPDWPYKGTDDDNQPVAAFSPVGVGDFEEVWGATPRFIRSGSGSDRADLAVTTPHDVFALMSYCDANDAESLSQGRWIAKHNYEKLADNFLAASAAAATSTTVGGDHLLVHGVIDGNTSAVTVEPVIRATLPAAPPAPEAGDYAVELYGADGTMLTSVPFTPFYGSEMEVPHQGFFVPVAAPTEDVARVAITKNGVVETELLASANAPDVSIVAPAGGANLTEPSVALEWAGSDPDADPLTYTVQFSPDDGATWSRALTVGFDGTSISVPRYALEGTTQGRLRVLASDGLRTTSAVSDAFTVADNQPFIVIDSPVDGETFAGGQPILLEASAYDPEGGSLDGTAIAWSSDLDGPLGTGDWVQLRASDLTEGTHTLTATVTDATGLSSSSSVAVHVARIPIPPTPQDLSAAVTDANQNGGQNDVSLSWTAVDSSQLDHYVVYRNGTAVASVEPSGTSTEGYTDLDVPAGSHTYEVSAVGSAGGESDRSAPIAVTVVELAAPTGLTASCADEGSWKHSSFAVYTSWNATEGADGYRLYRQKTTASSPWVIDVDGTAHKDQLGWKEGTYDYWVTAVSGSGSESEPSSVVRVDVSANDCDGVPM